jgi:transketolase
MRRAFADILLTKMEENESIVLVTADMGYGLWDKVRDTYPKRFFNVGSAEQLMIGCAAGMAMEGKIPVCYSITSFALFRPFEFIRNFMQYEKLPIKVVGGGRDRDYGYLGFTHWAEEDMGVLSNFPTLALFKPATEVDMTNLVHPFLYNGRPSYMNLVK